MAEQNVLEPDSGKPGPGDRGTEPPSADSKRFKPEGKSGSQATSGATGRSRIPQISTVHANRSSVSSASATSTPHKLSPKAKPAKEKKDVCCLKSSSTSFQSLQDQNGQSPAPSSGSAAPTARSPRSSIFSRFLHRQGNAGADGAGTKNSKSSKAESGKAPKSPKSRLSDGRLKLFNRTSSLKEVKIAIPASAKPTSAKSSGPHNGQRTSGLRQPTAREKASSKTKDASKNRNLQTPGQLSKSGSDRSIECGAAGETQTEEGNPSGESSSKANGKKNSHHGNVEAMETSAAPKEVPKCRRESVQAWVNSISDERLDGVEDMEQGAVGGTCVVTMETAPPDESGAGDGVKAEDDELTLGAEAKLLTPPKDVVLSRSTKHRLAEVGAASGRNRQTAWREMFSQIRTESFNSEGSAHSVKTWDSIDQLLSERTGDPEEILTNLGFHSQESDDSLPSRIPERFLRQQSVANGISVSKFIDSNPDLKEYVALTRSLSEPSTASLASGDSEKETPSRKSSPAGMSIASVVKTLTFIRKMTANMSWKEIDMTRKMLKPVDSATARLQSQTISNINPSGHSYSSILHPDNSEHLAEQGVYEDLAAQARRQSLILGIASNGQPSASPESSPLLERRRSSVLKPSSPRLSVSSIPERFTPITQLTLSTEGCETDADNVPSPKSGNSSPRMSRDRIPARFSPSPESMNTVVSPQLLNPSPSPSPEPSPDDKPPEGLNEGEKRNSLNIPNDEPRRKSVSLWKRLSDAGREMEQRKSIATFLSQPKNFIDVSRSSNFPDIPLRFFIHSNGSILNPALQNPVQPEQLQEKRKVDEPKVQSEVKKVEDENMNNLDSAVDRLQATPDSGDTQEISGDLNSNSTPRKQSIKVMLRIPTEEREKLDKLEGHYTDEVLMDQPIKIHKRRLNSESSVDRASENEEPSSHTEGRPSKKIRRKLGSMCKATDQAILLRSLDKSSRSNSIDEAGNENQEAIPMETDSEIENVNYDISQPRESVTSDTDDIRKPKLSFASDGLADDEMEQIVTLSRREKASKYLRKYLSQAEEDVAAESDSDGSIGDLNDNVEIGTAVLIANEASRVLLVENQNRVDEGEATTQPNIRSDPDTESQEEPCTTDQGSISGDDVEDIYNQIQDFEVQIDDITNDTSSITASHPVEAFYGRETGDGNLTDSADVRAAKEYFFDDAKVSDFLRTATESHNGNVDDPPFEQSKRRQTICPIPAEVEKLKKAEASTFDHGVHGRWSDGSIRYDMFEKRRRFSRQDNVQPTDLPNHFLDGHTKEQSERNLEKDIQNGNDSSCIHTDVSSEDIITGDPDKTNPDCESVEKTTTMNTEESDTEETVSTNLSGVSTECNSRDTDETNDCSLTEDNSILSQRPELTEFQETSKIIKAVSDKNEDLQLAAKADMEDALEVITDVTHEELISSSCSTSKSLQSVVPEMNNLGTDELGTTVDGASDIESVVEVSEKPNRIDSSSIIEEHFHSTNVTHTCYNIVLESELNAKCTDDVGINGNEGERDDISSENLYSDMIWHDKENENSFTDEQLSNIMDEIPSKSYDVNEGAIADSFPLTNPFDEEVKSEKQNSLLSVPFSDIHDSRSVSDEGYNSPVLPHVENILPLCSMPTQGTMELRKEVSIEETDPIEDQSRYIESKNEEIIRREILIDENGSAAISINSGQNESGQQLSDVTATVDAKETAQSNTLVLQTQYSDDASFTEEDVEMVKDCVEDQKDTKTNETSRDQPKQLLIVSLGEEKSSVTAPDSDQGNSDDYEDMLQIVNLPRKLSLVRYTESERDESICSESEDQECIYQEHLIDDNVLDRSLSEHSYLHDLLKQLKQNQQNMERPRRRSSDGSISRRFSTASQSHELEQSWGDLLADSPLVDKHRKKSSTLMQNESVDNLVYKEKSSEMSEPCVDSVCHEKLDDKLDDSKRTMSQAALQSFDLEEVSSEDNFSDTLPKLNHDKTLSRGFSQRALSRAFSGQSDSSGFVEMESVEIDWTQLKVSGLGSSADSESSSRRSSRGTSHPAITRLKKASVREKQKISSTMGAAMDSLGKMPNEGKELPKSDEEESEWDIIENGHSVSHKDFLFGVPQKMKGKPEETTRRPKRRSRKQRPAEAQWVSRLYIDPPTSPKVTPTNKMEVKVMIEKGKVTHIENAQAVPVERSSMEVTGRQQRTVSFLHLCVASTNSELQIRPVDKGDFILPNMDDWGSSVDVSQHQVLCSLLRRSSTAWAPDDETARQYTLWNSSDATERKERHVHLLEEVKLIQHAITKFKVEFRVLDLRSQSLYKQDPAILTPEQRAELVELGNLRSQILQEINELERLLSERMRTILRTEGSMYTGDLTSLNTVHQVVEVLKEQVYHSSIINGMSLNRLGDSDNQPPADSEGAVSTVAGSSESQLVKQLSELQEHIEEHQVKTTNQLTTTLEQMRQALLAEVRESVRGETEHLRKQVMESEKEVRDLKEQLHVHTKVPAGVVKPESKKAEVRFPVNGSQTEQGQKVLVETVTKRVSIGKREIKTLGEGNFEFQVSRSNRVEASPLESGFRPIAKQESEEEAHL